ncbi:hypothetical protein [Streptomyces sp. NPDC059455]|uniref:hypothetical protein n=1 Tax=Streptomyces sp. NPDC059455 TaxID=3346837 RepID=UPI0036805073
MQIIHTPGGDVIAVMKAKEAVLAEAALMRYVAGDPDSNLAARMLWEVATVNERVERRTEGAAEAAASDSV